LAIASSLHSFRQDAQASFAKGRDSKGENEDLPPYQIHQILKLKLTQILGHRRPNFAVMHHIAIVDRDTMRALRQ
jgi:hypothetical protein